MQKIIINSEELIAGTLLNFDCISSLDISLLSAQILKDNPNYQLSEIKLESLKDYIEISKGKISLKKGLSFESYIKDKNSTLKEVLEHIAGPHILNFFQNFDIEEFVLRKVDYNSAVKKEDIENMFGKIEQEALKRLEEKRCLITVWNDEIIYEDYEKIKLSVFGKLRLFKSDNKTDIENFIKVLRILRYDTKLLDDFLKTQNLDLLACQILKLANFIDFCKDYDRAIESEVSPITFTKLKNDKKNILSFSGKRLMLDMLSVWDNNIVFICNPNHIFTVDINEEKSYINWNDIDVEKMFKANDFKMFVTSNCSQASNYVQSRLKQQIQEVKKENKETAVSYLAVIEQYCVDGEYFYLVRGLIRKDVNGYSLAFNPEYEKSLTPNHDTQNVYTKKRKNNFESDLND